MQLSINANIKKPSIPFLRCQSFDRHLFDHHKGSGQTGIRKNSGHSRFDKRSPLLSEHVTMTVNVYRMGRRRATGLPELTGFQCWMYITEGED
ncbi:hypothetical protein CEXT_79521 [Caerostris extrusa]|uniref:Uncharacterized protein n=1 Tax=Caerostris extrusa TaxID=172846 RepID=A0AAV4UQR0_CAEEX|nr:hypothetical protein CEXT_79521 [Caerostris extrusa]